MDGATPKAAGRSGPDLTWAAFLVMAFVVVGLAGLFASYAVPLPLERALARDAALDAALATTHAPDPAAALAALRDDLGDELGDSAAAILAPGGDLAARIGAERAAMRARLQAEADAVARRTRWLLGIVTLMGAVFGVAILHMGRRS